MKSLRIYGHVVVTLASALQQSTYGSTDSIGPNGINSASLGLTGDGVSIGQVEAFRPGKPGFDTAAMCCEATIEPTDVFVRDMDAAVNQSIDDHAIWVAGVMISTDNVATGVATDASLFSSAHAALTNDQPSAALAAQHVSTVPDVRATNMSFGMQLTFAQALDGDSMLTSFVDWSAREHDVLYVVAGNQGTNIPVPTDHFNGLTVAASTKEPDGVFRRVALLNDFSMEVDAVGDRTSTDLLAPGVQLDLIGPNGATPVPPNNSGTSFAAPHITGTVALLQEHGENQIMNVGAPRWTANARRHEVMKAVLMNSADKIIDDGTFMIPGDPGPAPPGTFLGMQRTVIDQQGMSWLDSEAYGDGVFDFGTSIPLDDQMGAGHLNASRALQQFSPGEHDSDSADVPLIGWDYGQTSGEDDHSKYVFAQELLGGSFISITLAWDRHVEFQNDTAPFNEFNIGDTFKPSMAPAFAPENDDQINDLDIHLLPKGALNLGAAIAESYSAVGTLEHLFFRIPETGEYEFWINQFDADIAGGQDYAVAWWAAAVPNPNPGQGDYSGNGTVGPEDYDIWVANFGSTTMLNADGNGNGVVDAADYTVWRDHLGLVLGSASVQSAHPVPEPATIWMLLLTVALVATRRSLTGK